MAHMLIAIIYLAFISLGLPDAVLGSAWPAIYPQLGVPLSYAGVISMIISCGTIVSSLLSEHFTIRLGTGKVTAISVGITAVSLFGFSYSASFIMLCLWAIPYGLGAGSVDACLNNYVATHYESKHMNWLHCMWGIGASLGPYLMGFILSRGKPWPEGYQLIGGIQILLTLALFLSLPLWKTKITKSTAESPTKALSIAQVLGIPGVKPLITCFFCYCALEQTAGLWAASYLTLHRGISPESAASFVGFFYLGITGGRAVSGFLSLKLNDRQMISLGIWGIMLGIGLLLIPYSTYLNLISLFIVGLGCAPIYPAIIHSTPERFGAQRSQAIIGSEMASAYIGSCVMPVIFGLLARYVGISLFPIFLLTILLLMMSMFYHLEHQFRVSR